VTQSTGNRNTKVIRSTADFARYVGLARTTVSRVLNGQPGLKQKTIDRVRRAVEETGFTLNAYALHLKGKRTATIGICMESLFTPPAVAKLAMLQKKMRARDVSSMIEVVDLESTRAVVRQFLSMRVSAVVFIGHFNEAALSQRIEELSQHGIPHLVMDQAGIPNANTVALDRRKAMADMTRHLIGLGHSSFGLLGLSGAPRSVQDRLGGVADALVANGLSLERSTLSLDHLHPRSNDFEFGRALAKSFLGVERVPTAFVALNDEIAVGAIHGFQDAGLRVPEDVSVSGFNNQDICLMTKPSLTSVDQQIEATVEAAAEILFAKISNPAPRRVVVRTIQPLVIVRGSTGRARGSVGLRGRPE
jgi:DNA-binding LacI/PurR family transcriptional regulator